MSNSAVIVRNLADFLDLERYGALFPNNALSAPLLKSGDWLYTLFAHPRVPIFAILAYLLVSKSVFKMIRTTFNVQPKGPALQSITILHSAILAIYSGWTCYNTGKIVLPLIFGNGLYPTLCDISGKVWFEDGLGFWITHFYLSKYYEFIDSW